MPVPITLRVCYALQCIQHPFRRWNASADAPSAFTKNGCVETCVIKPFFFFFFSWLPYTYTVWLDWHVHIMLCLNTVLEYVWFYIHQEHLDCFLSPPMSLNKYKYTRFTHYAHFQQVHSVPGAHVRVALKHLRASLSHDFIGTIFLGINKRSGLGPVEVILI